MSETAPVDAGAAAATRGTLNVRVPAKAVVFVNGQPTKSMGAERRYVSNDMTSGMKYSYELRAEIDRDGTPVSRTQVVVVKAGESVDVAFDFDAADSTPVAAAPAAAPSRVVASRGNGSIVQTRLTVNVPDGAMVYLAGSVTGSTGAKRTYVTSTLTSGQTWKDYTIRVTSVRDGQTETREQTINLAAGDDRELSFNFDAPKVARVAKR